MNEIHTSAWMKHKKKTLSKRSKPNRSLRQPKSSRSRHQGRIKCARILNMRVKESREGAGGSLEEPADCKEEGEKVGQEPRSLRKVLQEVPEPKCSTKGGPPDQVPSVPSPQWVTVSEQQVEAALLNFRVYQRNPCSLLLPAEGSVKHSHGCHDHTRSTSHFYKVLNQAKLTTVLLVDVYTQVLKHKISKRTINVSSGWWFTLWGSN